ncbi:MAG: hypothetical protein F9K38_10275 [Pseudorhodoplanes sp.]|nr:MAG: hypothetical protein F9K38_10275 [Pseudorhodoplanes sp.]
MRRAIPALVLRARSGRRSHKEAEAQEGTQPITILVFGPSRASRCRSASVLSATQPAVDARPARAT